MNATVTATRNVEDSNLVNVTMTVNQKDFVSMMHYLNAMGTPLSLNIFRQMKEEAKGLGISG